MLSSTSLALGGLKPSKLSIKDDKSELTLNTKDMSFEWKTGGSSFKSIVSNGKSGSKTTKNIQKSAVSLQYFTNKRIATLGIMNSFELSVSREGATAKLDDGKLVCSYTIGDSALTIDDIPKGIPLDTYLNRIKAKLSEKENKEFLKHYREVKLKSANESFMIRKKDDLGKLLIKTLHTMLFEKGGFTREEMLEANEKVGYKIKNPNPKIEFDLELSLSEGDLIATIDLKKLKTTPNNDLVSLNLFPYFLSSEENTEGYMFVPDGSGAIINFSSKKNSIAAYQDSVFGYDRLIRRGDFKFSDGSISQPVFGIKTKNGAILAIIEEGAALASINAEVSGHSDEFNKVYPCFNVIDVERVAMDNDGKVTTPKWAEDAYTGRLRVRYHFIEGEDAGYVEMAKFYQEYLLKTKQLKKHELSEDAPCYVEVLGAVSKRKFFLGIPYNSSVVASTNEQAKEMYLGLKENGIKNVQLVYNGIFENGIFAAPINRGRLDRHFNKKGLSELKELIEKNGDGFYPAINLNKVFTKKGFSSINDGARAHDGTASAVFLPYNITYRAMPENNSCYISPAAIKGYAKQSFKALNYLDTFMVQDLGNEIIPSYKRKNSISRVHAIPYIEETLALKEDKLILDNPHSYALKYAKAIRYLPRTGSSYKLLDAHVPFLNIAYDGCISYSMSAFDISSKDKFMDGLMYAMESKSAPSFRLSYNGTSMFENTSLNTMGYFNTAYKEALPIIKDIYDQYNAFYKLTKNAKISKHIIHSENVRQVIFDNGVELIVNYGPTEDKSFNIPPHSYILKGGK